MPVGKGVNLLVGVAKAATWGTSVAVGASKGFRVLSFTWEDVVVALRDESYNADASRRQSALVSRRRINFTFRVDLKYEGLDTLLALFFGTAGVPSGVGPYTHRFYRKNDMTGLFFTLAWYDGVVTHEVDSAKFTGLTLEGTAGGVVTAEFRGMGRRRQENTANNPSGLAALTEPTNIDRVQFLQSIVSYQTAAQNGTLVDLELSRWTVAMEREYEDDDRAYTSLHAPFMREPMGGRFDLTGEVQVPYEATARMADVLAGTTRELKFAHVLDANRHADVWIPSVTWEGFTANPSDYRGIPHVVRYRGGDKAVTTPTGFQQPVPYIELVNSNAADPLA
jgi:hypothetical protein